MKGERVCPPEFTEGISALLVPIGDALEKLYGGDTRLWATKTAHFIVGANHAIYCTLLKDALKRMPLAGQREQFVRELVREISAISDDLRMMPMGRQNECKYSI